MCNTLFISIIITYHHGNGCPYQHLAEMAMKVDVNELVVKIYFCIICHKLYYIFVLVPVYM